MAAPRYQPPSAHTTATAAQPIPIVAHRIPKTTPSAAKNTRNDNMSSLLSTLFCLLARLLSRPFLLHGRAHPHRLHRQPGHVLQTVRYGALQLRSNRRQVRIGADQRAAAHRQGPGPAPRLDPRTHTLDAADLLPAAFCQLV